MSNDPGAVRLGTVVAEPHERVLTALEDPETGARVAVAWCSAHVVAAERVLFAAAMSRHVPGARALVQAVRAADRRLQGAAFRLDRRTTGDVGLSGLPVERLAQDVREALREHADAEAALVRGLEAVLDGPEQAALAARLADATSNAPTRAHPHTWHGASLVGRLQAGVDRVRDVLDNRTGVTGRPVRAARPLGRWGSYATAAPLRAPDDTEGESR